MTAKEEALNALDTARKMLDSPEPLTGLRLNLLRTTLEHAATQIEAIQEVKRKRKANINQGAHHARS